MSDFEQHIALHVSCSWCEARLSVVADLHGDDFALKVEPCQECMALPCEKCGEPAAPDSERTEVET